MRSLFVIFALFAFSVFAKQIVVTVKNTCIFAGPTLANKCVESAKRGYVYNVFESVNKFYRLGKDKYILQEEVSDYDPKSSSLDLLPSLGATQKLKFHNNTDDQTSLISTSFSSTFSNPSSSSSSSSSPTSISSSSSSTFPTVSSTSSSSISTTSSSSSISSSSSSKAKATESSPRPTLGKDVVYYAQGDERWADVMYSATKTKSQTIKTSGCGPTSMAMVVATLGGSGNGVITPTVLADYALEHNHRTASSGTEWAFFCDVAKTYELECRSSFTTDEIVKALQENDKESDTEKKTLVVASMGPGYYTTSGHYILLHGTDGKYIYSHDPAKASREKALISVFKSQSKAYFIISKK